MIEAGLVSSMIGMIFMAACNPDGWLGALEQSSGLQRWAPIISSGADLTALG